MAEANAAAHLPALARSLWGYAWICVEIDRSLPGALIAIQEAIDLYQRLVEQSPQAFSDDLWSAHHTLADVLDGLGRADEAIELRRELDEAEIDDGLELKRDDVCLQGLPVASGPETTPVLVKGGIAIPRLRCLCRALEQG
ncbi:hypothetical protein DER29_6109 [Micromonospora sp. M71_S20]|uniref:hypothetical protein n=1 Tax=Micromonospora sp. M71_S20 TaxID=592872 RepID=UPI000F27C1BC|nr:hypothetical protein DER29_6109 [Micromonospora sp. M71_S20]